MRSNPRSEEVIEIGKRIRDIRTNKKMSQADLADKANISFVSGQRYRDGQVFYAAHYFHWNCRGIAGFR